MLFGGDADYLNLAQAIRQHKEILTASCQDIEEYDEIVKSHRNGIIPLFSTKKGEKPKVISRDLPTFEKGMKLVYLPEAY